VSGGLSICFERLEYFPSKSPRVVICHCRNKRITSQGVIQNPSVVQKRKTHLSSAYLANFASGNTLILIRSPPHPTGITSLSALVGPSMHTIHLCSWATTSDGVAWCVSSEEGDEEMVIGELGTGEADVGRRLVEGLLTTQYVLITLVGHCPSGCATMSSISSPELTIPLHVSYIKNLSKAGLFLRNRHTSISHRDRPKTSHIT
jgi:hypothetical protein